MTVLLVSTEQVKKRMVMSSEALGVNPAIESAIIAAQLRVEAELDTSLEFTTSSDLFFINTELFGGVIPAGNLWRLYLKNGLLKEDIDVTVLVSHHRAHSFSELSSNHFSVDHDKGIVYLDAGVADGKFVQVIYSSGFTISSAPAWLREAILGYVPMCLTLGPAADQTKKAPIDANLRHAEILLHRHLRNVGTVFRAIC